MKILKTFFIGVLTSWASIGLVSASGNFIPDGWTPPLFFFLLPGTGFPGLFDAVLIGVPFFGIVLPFIIDIIFFVKDRTIHNIFLVFVGCLAGIMSFGELYYSLFN